MESKREGGREEERDTEREAEARIFIPILYPAPLWVNLSVVY